MQRKEIKTHRVKNYVYITESITAETWKMEQPQEDTRNKKEKTVECCVHGNRSIHPSNELNKRTSNSCHIQPPEALSYKATGCNHDGAVSGWQHNSICLKRRAPCAICRPILALPNRHFHCFNRFSIYTSCHKVLVAWNIFAKRRTIYSDYWE